ncbi:zona pellucida sperm-binding protein 3d.2 isoform X2 [Gymnodraco acuticeps]|uniref:Zona pellucida sperm-binding protein 3 n=1 Tax=Gymnodraco acuticeps TaxID=8218 RepID=A0A6P8U7U8_GYMAC|nr:zona pellucida sperm-binding protein 3d.2 isoform X2 [Gymnodraco acuticeps]
MVYLSLLFMLPLLSTIYGGTVPGFEALTQPTQVMRPPLPQPYLQLPVFVDSRFPLVEKEQFTPSRGTGQEPLPEPVRDVLFPARTNITDAPGVKGDSVRISCKSNKMLVQVQRSILGTGEPYSRLKLGSCQISKTTENYIYFKYDLGMCGTKRTIINNQITYSNKLQYKSPQLQGPIRRAVSFILPVSCFYNRYQYSYKIGYRPKSQPRNIFKPMKNRVKFLLTPQNAQWERLSPSDQYELGQPMYFEAKAPALSEDQRLYVHFCYATPERSHNSTPQFQVVANYGCMVESKDSRSRFILYKTNAVRFSVDAFLFTGMTGQLYMHCSMSVSSSVPTPRTKSCNYDTKERRWVELYGPDSVCTCCDSNCSSAAAKVTKVISSRPWTLDPKGKLTTALKWKKVSTATTTKTTTKVAPQPETKSEVTDWRKSSQPEERTETEFGKVEDSGEDWPIGRRGVTWVEMEGEEELVKGSAVKEKKKEEKEKEKEEEEKKEKEKEEEDKKKKKEEKKEKEKKKKEKKKEEKKKVAATHTI